MFAAPTGLARMMLRAHPATQERRPMRAKWMARSAAAPKCLARSWARSAAPAHLRPQRALMFAAPMSPVRPRLRAHFVMLQEHQPMRAEWMAQSPAALQCPARS